MYIPVSYWQTQGSGIAHVKGNYFVPSFPSVPQSFDYTFNNTPIAQTASVKLALYPVCKDITTQNQVYRQYTQVIPAGAFFFCSATEITSYVPCNSYLFFYDSIGCGFPGSATARYYDCSGNLQTRTVSSGGGSFVACATSFGNQPCVLTEASTGSCTSSLSQPAQCCINTPPNTGAEARYINVRYEAASDIGTFYYSYVNEKAEIVNDTLVFNESKNIIAQGPPIWMQQDSSVINYRIDYTIGEKFQGNTIAYPFIDTPVDVTFQLKRTATGGGSFDMPEFQFRQRIFKNGFPIANNSGSNAGRAASSLNGTTTLGTIGIPLPQQGNGLTAGIIVPCTWITNVSPQAKGALLLTSCTTTHSLWVTLNDYSYYQTGSVLKVNTPALSNTSSCWTVSNLTSSLSTSVAITNIEISQSYVSCGSCI